MTSTQPSARRAPPHASLHFVWFDNVLDVAEVRPALSIQHNLRTLTFPAMSNATVLSDPRAKAENALFPAQNADALDAAIDFECDFNYDYFGFKVCFTPRVLSPPFWHSACQQQTAPRAAAAPSPYAPALRLDPAAASTPAQRSLVLLYQAQGRSRPLPSPPWHHR